MMTIWVDKKGDNMEEIWKDIYFVENGIEYDYRGLYQVSNKGRVKSLSNNKTRKEKILKSINNEKDYLLVGLYKNCKIKRFRVHRLVAHMFLSESYFDGAEIDHIDTNRSNNSVENLKWCNREDNMHNELTKQKIIKKATKSIIGINLITGEFRYAESLNDLCKKYNYNSIIISCCCNKKIRKVKSNGKEYVYDYTNGVYDGFHWKYID